MAVLVLAGLFVFWFPWRWRPGAETCTNFMLSMILVVLRAFVVYCNYLYIVNLLQGASTKTKIHAGALSPRFRELEVELQQRINSATCDTDVKFVLSSTAIKWASKTLLLNFKWLLNWSATSFSHRVSTQYYVFEILTFFLENSIIYLSVSIYLSVCLYFYDNLSIYPVF